MTAIKQAAPIDNLLAKMPAHIAAFAAAAGDDDVFSMGATGPRLPRLGIKGKVWHWTGLDGETQPIVDPDTEDPISSLYVALADSRKATSRHYYASAYEPDAKVPAACFSLDGIKPHEKSPDPQATSCAMCPQNQVGSRVSEQGKKMRACGMKKDIVVVPVSRKGDVVVDENGMPQPTRLSLPAVSAFNLDRLVKDWKVKTGGKVSVRAIVIKLSFNVESAFPEVVFTPVGFLSDEALHALEGVRADEAVREWIDGDAAAVEELTDGDATPAPAPSGTVAPADEPEAPAPAPKRSRRKPKADPAPAAEKPAPAPSMFEADEDDDEPEAQTQAAAEAPAGVDKAKEILNRFAAFGK